MNHHCHSPPWNQSVCETSGATVRPMTPHPPRADRTSPEGYAGRSSTIYHALGLPGTPRGAPDDPLRRHGPPA